MICTTYKIFPRDDYAIKRRNFQINMFSLSVERAYGKRNEGKITK